MTSYLDVIPLDKAKKYLKVDAGQIETDNEITAMINSALSYIEKRTGWQMLTKTKPYYGAEFVVVYDYPITTTPTEQWVTKSNYSIIPTVNGQVVLSVGIGAVSDMPPELIDAGLQIISFLFYNSETNGAENSIPDFINGMIDVNRRFI